MKSIILLLVVALAGCATSESRLAQIKLSPYSGGDKRIDNIEDLIESGEKGKARKLIAALEMEYQKRDYLQLRLADLKSSRFSVNDSRIHKAAQLISDGDFGAAYDLMDRISEDYENPYYPVFLLRKAGRYEEAEQLRRRVAKRQEEYRQNAAMMLLMMGAFPAPVSADSLPDPSGYYGGEYMDDTPSVPTPSPSSVMLRSVPGGRTVAVDSYGNSEAVQIQTRPDGKVIAVDSSGNAHVLVPTGNPGQYSPTP